MKKLLSLLLCALLSLGIVACADTGSDTQTTKINILFSGWVNTPTTDDDPYRAYIQENYGMTVELNANTDFENSAIMAFNSTSNRPDIISFPSYTSFKKFADQGVLIDDWTPYLEYMPNFARMLNQESQAASKEAFTVDGKLTALWTPADPPTWSLKIREDWMTMYRTDTEKAADWAPQITTGIPIMIPETYVRDLGVRLGLYKRIGEIRDKAGILDMREELTDRFGKLPEEVDNLLKTVEIKQLCREANVEKIDAGAKGILITFHNNVFKAPDKLINWVSRQFGVIKIRPDQKLFVERDLQSYAVRVETIKTYVGKLVEMVKGD